MRYSEHEIPHMLNDDSWEKGIGPLHDPPSEELFLQMKSLHDKTCVHIDLDITDQVQEQFNDFLHARNKYASTNDDGSGDIDDVVFQIVLLELATKILTHLMMELPMMVRRNLW